jgi:hypothetical protein|tara:strand:- start:44 stop:250 length:207 start_codon:yes stop_codon:yes gene_type:complete
MSKEIKITMSDAQFKTLQNAYAYKDSDGNDAVVDEAYIKGRLTNVLKARVRSYDESKQAVSYSTFSPS